VIALSSHERAGLRSSSAKPAFERRASTCAAGCVHSESNSEDSHVLLTLALTVATSCAHIQTPSGATPKLLESRWIDGIGTVALSSPANGRLAIAIRDASGATSTR
jgi:hypothetical protein